MPSRLKKWAESGNIIKNYSFNFRHNLRKTAIPCSTCRTAELCKRKKVLIRFALKAFPFLHAKYWQGKKNCKSQLSRICLWSKLDIVNYCKLILQQKWLRFVSLAENLKLKLWNKKEVLQQTLFQFVWD